MMTLIRLFAVMDRKSEVSLQSAHRYIKLPTALAEIARRYSGGQDPLPSALATCSTARTKFLSVYGRVDFAAFRRIQSFRNGQIAHIAWPDAEKAKVTYSEVEMVVRACCEMAGQLTLMISGNNDEPEEHLNEARHDAYEFWLAAIAADAEGRL
ncbi:hypothetical protein LHFGNBLO_004412 [Mesorhizobium sp. AR10]|uniref:hypothetical protein n=1 Tax=Mesorhizobium sp. AR10 TaxID=2865839 RepID=UPI00215DEBD3|nr:hypothetical protein [Mesorhizobium sp. AR10]UVK37388.1 hypothetical protein LHFGNBLO_004412 [Mesorhizobium sp. AR10]